MAKTTRTTKKHMGTVIEVHKRQMSPLEMLKEVGGRPFRTQFCGDFSGQSPTPCDLCAGSGAAKFVFGRPVGRCGRCHGSGCKGGR